LLPLNYDEGLPPYIQGAGLLRFCPVATPAFPRPIKPPFLLPPLTIQTRKRGIQTKALFFFHR